MPNPNASRGDGSGSESQNESPTIQTSTEPKYTKEVRSSSPRKNNPPWSGGDRQIQVGLRIMEHHSVCDDEG